MDGPLLVGAAAARTDRLDPAELRLAAEAVRGRPRELEQLCDRRARGPFLVTLEPDQVRVEPVTGCAPLVLGDQRDRLGREPAVALEALHERRHEALHERDERRYRLEPRLRVAGANLDRAEARVRAGVPAGVRVVRQGLRR